MLSPRANESCCHMFFIWSSVNLWVKCYWRDQWSSLYKWPNANSIKYL